MGAPMGVPMGAAMGVPVGAATPLPSFDGKIVPRPELPSETPVEPPTFKFCRPAHLPPGLSSYRTTWYTPDFSQSTIEGRQGSSACFIIAFLVARHHLLRTGPRLPRLPSVAEIGQSAQRGKVLEACDERWGQHLRSCILNGNRTYDLVQGNGRLFDFDDIKVYFDEIMRLSNNTVNLRGISLDEGSQLPVFLDANEKREKEISPERKLREVLLRFCVSKEPMAGIFTIASMSFAIIGGNGESFFLFDSVSSVLCILDLCMCFAFACSVLFLILAVQHSHTSRGAGAVVLSGCEEIGKTWWSVGAFCRWLINCV
jgi:hypothetical protein